ncbi:sodium:solute symporter family protein [bacterium]|nr:sodium:solute symporter family protein [bacterium]
MVVYLIIILAYNLILLAFNIYRSKKVKGHDDFMLAGRSLSIHVIVFTLIATWIGSGTFIAGAEYAYKAGFSSLWLPAGAWLGIVVIYFLAAKIRTFGQYTIGDILEVRYGRFARLFGTIALIIASVTIVSYQFRAGGYILNIITDGRISVAWGQAFSAFFIIAFTALAGMISVAHTDLPNGILILVACVVAVPFVIVKAGGFSGALATLPAGHFQVFSPDFGARPALKAFGYFFATLMLLMGEQSMYQKFYSAKSPRHARSAVGLWIIGTIIVEVVVVLIAVFAAVYFWGQGKEGGAMVLLAARYMVPAPVGVMLLAAAWAVLLSTGTNFLLSPSTNVMRDLVQQYARKPLSEKKQIIIQKGAVIVLGLCAFAMIFVPTLLNKPISVLQSAYFAYTMYGVAITPALIAALAWKRATKAAGLISICSGALITLFLDKLVPVLWPSVMIEGDPWGIPVIFPALLVSAGSLFLFSFITKPPDKVAVSKLFPES